MNHSIRPDFWWPLLFLSLLIGTNSNAQPIPVWSLEECMDLTLQYNPYLQSEMASRELASYRIQEAESAKIPAVSGRGDVSWANKPEGILNGETYNVGIGLSQPLYQGGRIKKGIEAAKVGLEVSQYQYETVLLDIKIQVAEAYYQQLKNLQLLEIARQDVARNQSRVEEFRERYELGVARYAEVLQFEVELSNAELTLISAENVVAKGQQDIARAVGIPLSTEFDISREPEESILPQELDPTSFQNLVDSLPELQGFRGQIAGIELDMAIIKADRKPSVNADAFTGFGNSLFTKTNYNWNVGLTASMPLFNGKRVHAQLAQQEARIRVLQANQQGRTLDLYWLAQDAWLSRTEALSRIENAEKLVQSTTENLLLMEAEYREGFGTITQLIDAQTSDITAKIQLVQARIDFLMADAQLQGRLGIL